MKKTSKKAVKKAVKKVEKPMVGSWREAIGEEQAKHLHDKLDNALDSKEGFVYIFDAEHKNMTDSVLGMCVKCATKVLVITMGDYARKGGMVIDCDEE